MTNMASSDTKVVSQLAINDRIDAAIESVLKAAGSKLEYYMPASKDAMREAMRTIMSESYIKGSNDNFDAMHRRTK